MLKRQMVGRDIPGKSRQRPSVDCRGLTPIFSFLGLVLFFSFHAPTPAVGAQIPPGGLTVTAYDEWDDRLAADAFNGSGLTGDNHDDNAGNMWLSWVESPPTNNHWIKVDLGGTYTLDYLRVWNYNEPGATTRGIQQCDIYVAGSDPGVNVHNSNIAFNPTGWTLIVPNQILAQASGNPSITNTDSQISLGNVSAAFLAIKVDSNYGAGSTLGLSEIEIYSAGAGPEIDILGINGASIPDGDTSPAVSDGTDFGSADVDGVTVTNVFTVTNAGAATLNLTGSPAVTITGHTNDFSVTVQPSTSITAGNDTTFTIVFDPSVAGTRMGVVSIASDDSDEDPYTFSIQGNIPGAPDPALGYEPLGPSTRRTGLTFSEIMYHPADRTDGRNTEFIEIYNSNPFFEDISGWRLTGDFDFTFPSNTVIQGNSFLVVAPVPADVEAAYGITGVVGGTNAVTNALSNSSGTVRLRKRSGGLVLNTKYSGDPPWPTAADGTGHSLVLARPSHGESYRAWEHSNVKGGSPGAAEAAPAGVLENIVINEILAHTDLPFLDSIELFNNSSVSVDISGCWLSDDVSTNKFRISNGTLLGAQQFIAFDETQLGFALEASGESVFLVNSNGTRVIDALRFGGQANGVGYGRFPDGAPGFQELVSHTPSAANTVIWHRDVVINEIMYNPISGDSADEYVELYNRGGGPVDVSGWRFVDGISITFPDNTSIPAGGFLVVAKDAARMMANYPGLNPTNIIGDYFGTLANGGERIALAMPEPQTVVPGLTNIFPIVVDEVTYVDGGRWTRWSDGGGSSLELIDPRSDNRRPSNWADSDETSKAGWTLVERTGLLDNGSSPPFADQVQGMLFGEGEVLIDDVEVSVGGPNLVSNSDFESGVAGWFFQGTQSKSTWETTEGYASARSLHLRSSGRGDPGGNRIRAPLTATLTSGQTATIRARVRWLRGNPEILFRIKGNWLDVFGVLDVPSNLGTPGAANSTASANAGPTITAVQHWPILPQSTNTIYVSARVEDPDGLQSVTLKYRVDPSPTLNSVSMVDNGTQGDALAGDGLFTGKIPAQADGVTVAFRIEAVDNYGPAETTLFPEDVPTRECLVRVGEVASASGFGTYRFLMTASNINTWASREKTSNEDVDGTWVYGDFRVIYNIGGHYAGSAWTAVTYTSPKGVLCGYSLTFPDDDLFLNSTRMILDWPLRDFTYQREQLMFWMLEQFDLPNMYRRYVVLHVDGLQRGPIYYDVQKPGSEVVAEWFSNDSKGTLLKPSCWDEFDDAGNIEAACVDYNALELYTTAGGAKKTERYRWTWQPRAVQGSANDYTDLFQLIDAANAPNPVYQDSMESLADVDHWTRTFAMNDLVSFWDAFGNAGSKNTYLYKPENDTWKLIGWDMDVGLGAAPPSDPFNLALFPVILDDAMNRFWGNTTWKRLYWGALSEGMNTFFQTGAGTPINNLLNAKAAAFTAHGISPPASISDITSWIDSRRDFIQGQIPTAAFAITSNDGIDFSTGNSVVALQGTAPVEIKTIKINGSPYQSRWITVTNWAIDVPLQAGANPLALQGFDRLTNLVASGSITVTYTGANTPPEGNVVINEIMYHSAEPYADYIELYNLSATATIDLSRLQLNGVDYVFGAGSIIGPTSYVVIAESLPGYQAAYSNAGVVIGEYDGSLDNGGETISLIRTNDMMVIDTVKYDDVPPWSTAADGKGYSLQLIDPDRDNNRVGNWGTSADWQIVNKTGTSSSDLLYVYMTSAGDAHIDDMMLVAGSVPGVGQNYVNNGDFETVLSGQWNVSSNHADTVIMSGSLHLIASSGGSGQSSSVWQNTVPMVPVSTHTLSYRYLPGPNGSAFEIRLSGSGISSTISAPAPPAIRTPGTVNSVDDNLPAFPLLWINEIMPSNVTGIADNMFEREPWIELYNAEGGPIDLAAGNYYLTDSYSDLTKWAFPAGWNIGPGSRLLVWADNAIGETVNFTYLHAGFVMNSVSGSIALVQSIAGTPTVIDYLDYGLISADKSYGSYPEGDPFNRQTFDSPTPAGMNNPTSQTVTVRINEWMARNSTTYADPSDGKFQDWFELYNPGGTAIDLGNFRLTDNINRTNQFIIPGGTSIGGKGFLVIWADNDTDQNGPGTNLHVNFRLGGTGDVIRLYAPDGTLIDAISFGQQETDVSEGRWRDGQPEIYTMYVPTPGETNVIFAITEITDVSAGSATIGWQSAPGKSYQLRYVDSLFDTNWAPVGLVVTAATTATSLMDTNTAGVPVRYYRLFEVD